MSERKNAIRSDLRKVDAHKITPKEYEEAPELTDEQLKRAVVEFGGKPTRGRPKLAETKAHVSLRLDRDIVAHFRNGGTGWQREINAELRRAMTRREHARKKTPRQSRRARG